MTMPFKSHYIAWLLLAGSFISFVLGLSLPLFSSKTHFIGLVMGYDEVTLFGSVWFLKNHGEWFLALIIFGFTFLLPLLKYAALFDQLGFAKLPISWQQLLAKVDKWSMLDVFIVAQIIVIFKFSSRYVSINTEMGLYFLALSIVLRIILVQFFTKPAANI